jgi:hypothetical protein
MLASDAAIKVPTRADYIELFDESGCHHDAKDFIKDVQYDFRRPTGLPLMSLEDICDLAAEKDVYFRCACYSPCSHRLLSLGSCLTMNGWIDLRKVARRYSVYEITGEMSHNKWARLADSLNNLINTFHNNLSESYQRLNPCDSSR